MTSKLGFSVVAPIKRDVAALYERQQIVLLSLVEAMYLVDEKYFRFRVETKLSCADYFSDVLLAGIDGGKFIEVRADLLLHRSSRASSCRNPGVPTR